MKLSLPVLIEGDERDYDTPCYEVSVMARFTGDAPWREERQHILDTIRAALRDEPTPWHEPLEFIIRTAKVEHDCTGISVCGVCEAIATVEAALGVNT